MDINGTDQGGSEQIRSEEDDFSPEDMEVLNFLAELGNDQDAEVRVYRQGKGGYRDLTYLFACPPSEFSMSDLQAEPYNGGDFRVHARSRGGLVQNRFIRVAPLPNAHRAQDSAAIAGVQSQIDRLAALVEKIGMAALAPQPGPSRREMLEEFQLMGQILGGGGHAQPASDPIDMVTKIVTLSKELNLGGGGEQTDSLSVIMRAIETFGKPMAEMMAANKMAQAQHVPQLAHEPVLHVSKASMRPGVIGHPGSDMPAAPADDVPMNEQETQAMNMMKMYLGQLIGEAMGGVNPEGYAHLIADKAPDQLIDELIRPANYLELLAAIDSRVKQYPEWFADLRDIIIELLTPDNDADNNDASNMTAVNNVSAGTKKPSIT